MRKNTAILQTLLIFVRMKPLFYSDYLEGAHPEIMDALARTNMEQTPGYGEDEHCLKAAELIRKACNLPEADVHFLVGGTQTNATVIASILRPHQGVLCAETGHIGVHETGAIEHSGHKVLPLPAVDGKIEARQIIDAVDAHWADECHEHTVQPGMVYISFPTELGTIYSKSELQAISEACASKHLPLFIDGARLGYGLTSPACDITLPELAALADVFYIGGTKQGALFGEAVVIRNDALKPDFRYFIKQNGGMLAKGRLLGIQYEVLFSTSYASFDGGSTPVTPPGGFSRCASEALYFRIARKANEQAVKVREQAKRLGIRLFGSSPTNQVFLVAEDSKLPAFAEKAGYEFWQRYSPTESVVRVCTSWATPDSAIDTLLEAMTIIQ